MQRDRTKRIFSFAPNTKRSCTSNTFKRPPVSTYLPSLQTPTFMSQGILTSRKRYFIFLIFGRFISPSFAGPSQQVNAPIRFNEIAPKKPPLGRVKSVGRIFENFLSIGLEPSDRTLVPPKLVKSRKELNKKEFYPEAEWELSKKAVHGVEIRHPDNFPLREYVDYLRMRRESGYLTQKMPTKRLCHDFIEQRENELKTKKETVESIRKETSERHKVSQELIKNLKAEKRLAVLNDFNVPTEPVPSITHPSKKIIKRIYASITPHLGTKLREPYVVICSNHEEDSLPQIPGKSPKGRVVLVKIGEGLDQAGQTESLEGTNSGINLYDLLKDISQNAQEGSSLKECKKEFVMVLPKAFGFGDGSTKTVTYAEYTENYTYFKVDPKKIQEFMKENSIDPGENVSVKRIRDMLILLGLPLKTEEEKRKYTKIIEKERLRKERIESQTERVKQERVEKREAVDKRKNERLRVMRKSEEEKREIIVEKQKVAADKVKELSNKKEKEKAKKIMESAEKRAIKEQQAKVREHRNEVEKFVKKEVVKNLLDKVFKSLREKTMDQIIEDKSTVYVTKESIQSKPKRVDPVQPEAKENILASYKNGAEDKECDAKKLVISNEKLKTNPAGDVKLHSIVENLNKHPTKENEPLVESAGEKHVTEPITNTQKAVTASLQVKERGASKQLILKEVSLSSEGKEQQEKSLFQQEAKVDATENSASQSSEESEEDAAPENETERVEEATTLNENPDLHRTKKVRKKKKKKHPHKKHVDQSLAPQKATESDEVKVKKSSKLRPVITISETNEIEEQEITSKAESVATAKPIKSISRIEDEDVESQQDTKPATLRPPEYTANRPLRKNSRYTASSSLGPLTHLVRVAKKFHPNPKVIFQFQPIFLRKKKRKKRRGTSFNLLSDTMIMTTLLI
eukprot:TRINITY_DN858_c0_g2_i1.p1 TRINITY_DN858_c0_g2~~TRINITY_DN858_c0_g2_i1.p1  ORF type:complete len:915 (-),score=111.54 TRINITY_DN858_c0_g2_i1:7502-10246(-)